MGRSALGVLFGAAALLATSACGSDDSSPGVVPGPGGQGSPTNGGVPGSDGGVPGTNGSVPGTTNGGVPGTTNGGVPGVDGSAKGVVGPTGVWWTEIETTGTQDLPTVGILEGSKIRFVMRVVIEGTAPNQTATFSFCKLQTEWASDILPDDIHIIGFRPDATAAFDETRSVDFSGLSVGDAVPVPDLTFIGGGDETGAVLDEDNDGFPAITAFVRVILPFEVAEVITIDAKLDVNATDENTLSGTLDFDVEADILDSSSAGFVPASYDVTIVPDSDAVPITVHRLPGGGDCSAVPSTIEFIDIPGPLGDPVDPLVGPQYMP